MLQALIHLFTTQPAALTQHVQAYADLFGDEFGLAKQALRKRLVLWAAAICGLSLSMGLAGVALLLWAVTPPEQVHSIWILLGVPLLPLVAALACLWAASAKLSSDGAMFANFRQQLAVDRALMTTVSAGL
ncbi:hypothetical protein [Roseateles sp.]|uniref:hypothetical protein n=1 Tax=Roseateles sp. TaxID=1971397 RepID=UPI00286D2171|nr:hypothetical protein [Roseateles sp.]